MENKQPLLFESFFNSISLPKLTYHWHVMLLSTLGFTLAAVISRIISPIIFPKTYKNLYGIKRFNWDIHFVSSINCLLVVILSIPIFWDEELINDKVFGYDTYAGNVYAIACGNPGLDLYYMERAVLRPFLNYYGAVFLMFEISTPFVNIHWFMDKLGMTGTLPQLINGICLIVTFFCARIMFGFYMSYHTFRSVIAVIDQVPTFLCVIYGTSNIILNCLNAFWFFKIIEAIVKRFDKTGEKKHKHRSGGKAATTTIKSDGKTKKS
ncbi:8430_t:CDS:2 [Funneliformis mosseae]|uniref:8430_t:CDS:1 n=1 Tax=Funneliformis mosseae TaxID=27381 RepID=A0A9N9CJP4_FUNMO|nr:8430_t:CDS:2 [Funneliformis mosseae]